MALNFPDPETFGEPRERPSDKIDADDYFDITEYADEDDEE